MSTGLDWSIQEIARLAGTTRRTLRHYDAIGLVMPSRIGHNGYRYYDAAALRSHLEWLALSRQMASVERTITELERGEKPIAEKMFDGFDHTKYEDEVERLWGKDSCMKSDAWYRSLSQDQKDDFIIAAAELGADWAAAAQNEVASDSDGAQVLAQRHYAWLDSIPGTPRKTDGHPTKQYFTWMGAMYVADERLAKNYGGLEGATFVRDAMAVYADRNL